MSHRIAHGVPLRIENCLLRFNDHVHLHTDTLTRNRGTTSARLHLYDASDSRECRRE
jgi:hypothetical protein